MEKINFRNGQAPYISEANLNKMQDNMEDVSVPGRRNNRSNISKKNKCRQ